MSRTSDGSQRQRHSIMESVKAVGYLFISVRYCAMELNVFDEERNEVGFYCRCLFMSIVTSNNNSRFT